MNANYGSCGSKDLSSEAIAPLNQQVLCEIDGSYNSGKRLTIVPEYEISNSRSRTINLSPDLVKQLFESQSQEESPREFDRLNGAFTVSIMLSPDKKNVLVILGELHGKGFHNREIGRSILKSFDYVAIEGKDNFLYNRYTMKPINLLFGSQILDAMVDAKSTVPCDENNFSSAEELPAIAFLECKSASLRDERDTNISQRIEEVFFNSETEKNGLAIVGKAHVAGVSQRLHQAGWNPINRCSSIDGN